MSEQEVENTAITESVATRSGLDLLIEKRFEAGQIELLLRARTPKRCVLHWGIRGKSQGAWRTLPESLWPEGTTAAGADAMQTPFRRHNGESRVAISLNSTSAPDLIEFVLFFPDERRWDNNGRRNYQIAVPRPGRRPAVRPLQALKAELSSGDVLCERAFDVEDAGQLAVGVVKLENGFRALLLSDVSAPLALHWGISRRSPHEWLQPPESLRPPGTILWDGHTTQTPFELEGGLSRLKLTFPEAEAPLGIQFVLKQGPERRWLKHHGGNFYVPIHTVSRQASGFHGSELAGMAEQIIQAEMDSGSWTLMHRFNLCHDLLEGARGNAEALAQLYVWLRFSAIRQLTWQRNYNTKPRELAHAQDRLTGRLSGFYQSETDGRPLIRLMLATIGRGGDGQRIRDEVLHIMHRHHVKEVSGHFTEEWHQKLHNNTTPDDIVICEAYIEFLRSDGNLDRFYQVLRENGVTPERLRAFERPIRTDPDFVPHLKWPLIHDFENFLKVLKAVHSGTDLETAMNAARERLDADMQNLLSEVWNRRNDPPQALPWLVSQVTELRRRLSHLLHGGHELRALLYLDLALEQLIRVVVERNLHQHFDGKSLAGLIACVLENVTLSYEDAELAACSRHWQRLTQTPSTEWFTPQWSLHAKSAVDRISRALSDWTDRLYQLLQPKAEFLGQRFNAEDWTITLFSEEVVRGSSLGFVLSMVLQQIGRLLRQAANLGPWQIVSRGRGIGQVEVLDELRAVQGRKFGEPTIVVAGKVAGDEEIPEGIVAVIAPDVTDLVSHVAVRARNAQVLFAACSDATLLERLKSMRGRRLRLEVTAAGDVTFEEAAQAPAGAAPRTATRPKLTMVRPRFTSYVAAADQFNERIVGAKSCSQLRLRGQLPDWIRQPQSLALPFGVFEHVMALDNNKEIARLCAELAKPLKNDFDPKAAAKLREAVLTLTAPEELRGALREAFQKAGLAWPKDWEAGWRCIKKVWASKWNDRAILSRNRMGIKHEDLFMAVLIQPVVEADYAFVIHTANPSTGNRDELYAEVVLGLGETLVGNYPGRALSFIWDKKKQEARLLSMPAKSVGLYGSGVIFRSDSNGEDLAGYAGAGLYDSVLLNPPHQTLLDYSEEPLVWDEPFRNEMLNSIAKLGVAVETALNSPQDIEGAVAEGRYYVVQTRAQV